MLSRFFHRERQSVSYNRPLPAQMRLPMPSEPTVAVAQVQGRLFSLEQRSLLKGRHSRQVLPQTPHSYVAGVSMAARQGPVTVTIAELPNIRHSPLLKVVQHYRWAKPSEAGITRLRAVLTDAWGCQRALIGGPEEGRIIRLWLGANGRDSVLGELQVPCAVAPKLLDAVTAGRIAMYADDGSQEAHDFWSQMVRVRRRGAANDLHAYIEPSMGDDGFVASLGLAVLAAEGAATIPNLSQRLSSVA